MHTLTEHAMHFHGVVVHDVSHAARISVVWGKTALWWVCDV